MSLQATITKHHPRYYSLHSRMDPSADKEERKREYNRLAQREFRRRRKEHLKNLEQAQQEQNSEQSEEIERLRYQNEELRRENEALRAQVFGSSSSMMNMSGPLHVPDSRQYSVSPSISGASLSGAGSPPASLAGDLMPLSTMSLTSSMISSGMHAYTDPLALTSQPYSMVPASGFRHSTQSSPESSGFRTSRPAMGSSFQSMNHPLSAEPPPAAADQRRTSGQQTSTVMTPYDRNRAQAEIMEMFQPLFSDPSVSNSPERHLMVLRSLSDSLPTVLKPTKLQLEKPHYVGIDLIPSPSLRDRLVNVTVEIAQDFINDVGINGSDNEDLGQLIIWGDDALNEVSWEFSQTTLERWGWLLGREWVARTNFWRRQRGMTALPDW